MIKSCTVGLVLALIGAASASAAPPPASAFGRLPQVQDAAISPSGRAIALLGGTPDHRIISIAPIDGAQAKTVDIGKAEVRSVRWAGDNYLLVRASVLDKFTDAEAGGKFAYHLDRDFVLTSQGEVKGALLRHVGASDLATELPIVHVMDSPPVAVVQGLIETGEVRLVDDTRLPGKTGPAVTPALWRVDVATFSAQLVDKGPPTTDFWDVDAQGRARVRVESDDKDFRLLGRADDNSPWKLLVDEKDKAKRPHYLGYADSEASVYVAEEIEGHSAQVVRYSLADGARSVVGDPFPGAASLIVDPFTRNPVGVCAEWDKVDCRWLDARLGDLHGKLARALQGKTVSFYDWSKDRGLIIVLAEAPDAPPVWCLFDAVKGQLSPIAESYPELEGAAFGKASWFTYKSRDGLEIPAYLTLPAAPAPGKKPPLVVLPHGGPAARDSYEFDWWAQFLATRGYAVLQPQFRGSSGFGRAFEDAGHKEWGGKMQTDLLDGIADLAARGMIDPARVCVVGASYGGYAALAGAALHPEAYRCAVSVNGVSDLAAFIGEEAKSYGGDSGAVGYWRSVIGESGADAAEIAQASPSRHAANVRAPILLIASANDTTVPPEQSRIMAYALQQEGRPAEVVTLDGDDHYLSSSGSRIKMLEAIEAFLAKNLPVD
jgi:dipeptidyl aminopeptidase/acylaminoacyl peptidase